MRFASVFPLIAFLAILSGSNTLRLRAQSATPPAMRLTEQERSKYIGDSEDPGPLASDLSTSLRQADVDRAMRKVADWQLQRVQEHWSQDWTFAAMYAGFMAAGDSLPEPRYLQAMQAMSEGFEWRLGPRLTHADDQAIGQTYLGLYLRDPKAQRIAQVRQQFDQAMQLADDPAKPVWWWCDALFMAPPVWTRLYQATGEKKYLDYMDREWWITSKLLYDADEHLYFRDATYLNKREKNGKKIFWSRGNGWVMAGLARVLDGMPADYPSRKKYIAQFRQLAARVAELQGSDGLWRPGLLDADAYPLPEVSGSAFFVYAMAWGVHHHLLDRSKYEPVIAKAWAGLIAHIYEDGRLGCIQPIGAAPGDFKPASSYVYGVGAFLLAGSEVRLLKPGQQSHEKQKAKSNP
jgi:unsaturated rhamnogalacturonyl hydrolase